MDFQGGDPDGLRRLWRELQLAGAQLANSRAAVDRTMNEVCMATTVPTELRWVEDVWNLRALKPKGPHSYQGHVDQAKFTQRNVEKQLKTWKKNGTCTDTLTIDIAREYVALDIANELGWTAAGVASAIAASEQADHWWQVDLDIDLPPLGKVAAAAAVAAAAVAAAARDVSTGGIALG